MQVVSSLALPEESKRIILSTCETGAVEDLTQADWNRMLGLAYGDIRVEILSDMQREAAIGHCAAQDVGVDRSTIMMTLFKSTIDSKPRSYGAISPQAIQILLEMVSNDSLEAGCRFWAFKLIGVNLDDSKQGVELEEELWSQFAKERDENWKLSFISCLSEAQWKKKSIRIERFKELFREPKVSEDYRSLLIGSIGTPVLEQRCSLADGLEVYSCFLESEELSRENRKEIAKNIDGWVEMYRMCNLMKESADNGRGVEVQEATSKPQGQ